MKLYYFESLNARKACAVAKHLGLPVELVRIDMARGEHKTPGYLAINPNGKVPALTDGDKKLWEANAIMAYLARAAGSDLWRRDDDRQIEAGPGTFVLVPSGTAHAIINNGPGDVRFLNIHSPGGFDRRIGLPSTVVGAAALS